MKKKSNWEREKNWFEKQLFPGAEVLYPFLSLVCLFFFFYFFGRGEEFAVLNEKSPNWLNWYIFAILGFIFCSLWGIIKKWWSRRFLVIGSIILFFSFYSLQVNLYHLADDLIFLIGLSILFSICCCLNILKSNSRRKCTWALPLCVFAIYYVFESIPLMLLSCLVALLILSILETTSSPKRLKLFVLIGIAIFYISTALTYFPYNPILSYRNIKSISVSYSPRFTSLVIENDNKYEIVDGITGSSPLDVKFDCWANISPANAFVGFKTKRYKEYEEMPYKSSYFPIITTDSCVYFTSQLGVYKVIDDFKTSKNEERRLTSLIFQDFISLYQTNDTLCLNELKEHQAALQKKIEKLTTDSLSFYQDGINNEKLLREFSMNLSLGMLNSLCSDLIINNDINSAATIFSYQFFLTFFNSSIYNHVNYNTNIEIKIGNNSHSYSVTAADLKREDTFEPWVRMLSMSVALARSYLEIQSGGSRQIIADLESLSKVQTSFKNILDKKNTIDLKNKLKNILDKKNTIDLKNKLHDIEDRLSSYQKTPTIKRYAILTQRFLYQCVLRNFMPDYNSFFLNRFNEITPMVPMHSESISAYESMAELYSVRFDQDIKDVKKVRKAMDALKEEFDKTINMIGLLREKLGHNPLSNEKIKELLRESGIGNAP